MTLRFYNTLTRRLEAFAPIRAGKVAMYTCGPTVYDYAHIGNFRAYVFEDLLRRTLAYFDFEIRQVMNLTDVDDKTIRGACESGKSIDEYTKPYKDAFFEDLKRLRIERAELYPAATEHIDTMIAMIEKLLAKGHAYIADDASVYYAIHQCKDYGKLARIEADGQRSTKRIAHDEYDKENLSDFALWKGWTAADGDVSWPSPWGRGRPGWHIECSAMSMHYLGVHFDIHTGAVDNIFPHHENEIAQSEAVSEEKFVNYWLHCEHLLLDGRKMSKSLGNFYTLRDLLQRGFDGREIRWALMATHYRRHCNFSITRLESAREALQRIDDCLRKLEECRTLDRRESADIQALITRSETAFKQALADDLNLPEVYAIVFELIRQINKIMPRNEIGRKGAGMLLDAFARFDRILGVLDLDHDASIPDWVQSKLDARRQARAERDFSRSDQIRDELSAAGWILEDTLNGQRIYARTGQKKIGRD